MLPRLILVIISLLSPLNNAYICVNIADGDNIAEIITNIDIGDMDLALKYWPIHVAQLADIEPVAIYSPCQVIEQTFK